MFFLDKPFFYTSPLHLTKTYFWYKYPLNLICLLWSRNKFLVELGKNKWFLGENELWEFLKPPKKLFKNAFSALKYLPLNLIFYNNCPVRKQYLKKISLLRYSAKQHFFIVWYCSQSTGYNLWGCNDQDTNLTLFLDRFNEFLIR